MKITRINIRKLYGFMNKDIDFNENINLLVGINGSGKTSILNVINWILTPSIPNLCVTEFERITLYFTYKKNDYKITCKQNKKELTIDIENLTDETKYDQIQADIKLQPKEITKNIQLKERLIPEYEGLNPEHHERLAWNFLFKTLPNPVVIGLDRNLYTEENNEVTFIEDNLGRIRKSLSNKDSLNNTPLEKVSNLSGSQFMRYKNKILELNKRLNDKIMLSSFDETLTQDSLQEMLESPKITIKQVELLEEKVKNYFKENILEKASALRIKNNRNEESLIKIERYFSNLKTILSQSKDEIKDGLSILYITNVNQFRKIKELIKEFENFESLSKKYYEPINQYLETINAFLKDSAKELYFDKNNSKLRFRIINKDGIVLEENRDISTLSSGEKQILILFTYIKFNNDMHKLFIIDEPELSLHPKWQESFLNGIKTIMPANTQLFFATHSPSIVGKNKNYCKVLLPY